VHIKKTVEAVAEATAFFLWSDLREEVCKYTGNRQCLKNRKIEEKHKKR